MTVNFINRFVTGCSLCLQANYETKFAIGTPVTIPACRISTREVEIQKGVS